MKSRPKRFAVFFNAHGKRPWCVRTGGKWLTASEVYIDGMGLYSQYRPKAKRQPKAAICGIGRVRVNDCGVIWISR